MGVFRHVRSKSAKKYSKDVIRPIYRAFLFACVGIGFMWSVLHYDPSSVVYSRKGPSARARVAAKHGMDRRLGDFSTAESWTQCDVDEMCLEFDNEEDCEEETHCDWYSVLGKCEHSSSLCHNATKDHCDLWCPSYNWTYYSPGFTAAILHTGDTGSGTSDEILTLSGSTNVSNWTILSETCDDDGVECNCTGFETIEHHDECKNEVFGVPVDLREYPINSLWVLLIVIYGFVGIAIVCDTYFEPSLETISTKLKLTPDVAGATFMAMGSSAPELFTSLSDNFITKNNVGVGTIVGSALFNILIIVALSAFVARPPKHQDQNQSGIKVDWRPVLRDVIFYAISIGCLVGFIVDESVYWWEALIMIVVYICYIIFMTQNPKVIAACDRAAESKSSAAVAPLNPSVTTVAANPKNEPTPSPAGPETKSADHKKQAAEAKQKDEAVVEKKEEGGDGDGDGDDDDDDDDDWRVWPTKEEWAEKSCGAKFWFCCVAPLNAIFWLTIPNCANPDPCLQSLYPLTFVNCVLWMAVLCGMETMLVTWLGCWWEISAPVMGIVILAIGTSVPDAIASMLVARGGAGDMAIANAVGSNVFDILFGLGLPWIIADLVFQNQNPCGELTGIYVDVDGIVGAALILYGTVVFYIVVLALVKWKLNKIVAIIFVIMYLLIVAVLMLNEYCVGFTWKVYNDNCE